ncbi:MAG: PilZ domain-containing protein [Candidatus Omnitrophica bacterium]|nr:PilZ domain-containing protein [Candidatus Omnitrophota bacterium]
MDNESKNTDRREEKRKYTRKNISAPVSYRVVVPSQGNGLLENISEGGLCIILDKKLAEGTILEVKFELPGEKPIPIEIFVKVIWQKEIGNKFLTGVKFGT